MPQLHRRIAFSNKQKKEQLKAKRERKNFASQPDHEKLSQSHSEDNRSLRSVDPERKLPQTSCKLLKIKKDSSSISKQKFYLDNEEEIQGGGAPSKNNKYNLKFRKLHKDSSNLRKLQYMPVTPLPQEELEVTESTFYPKDMDYPKRPNWKKNISKGELDANENKMFRIFCEEIYKEYDSEELSLFELNLETWRQLWRVTEMSDIVLVIVDARFIVAQFPPYLYKHLVDKENKGVILVINKCDLIDPSLVLAWEDYCKEHYPKLIVVPFSSMEGKVIKKSTMRLAMHSSLNLIEACQKLVDENVDLSGWRRKVKTEMQDVSEVPCKILSEHSPETTDPVVYQRYKNNVLTIGTIGYPNVGKSSLINALMGKKVVSVSKTPGHTKHFQTIFITKDIKLCDCPGLVFPSMCPKQLQVILGSYPIAQVRDPLASIHYIACRIDMPSILQLNAKDIDETSEDFKWTPFHICEAWAKKRGYYIRTKGAKLDVFRAANELLRFTLVGFKSLIITLTPFGYSKNKEGCSSDPRFAEIARIQGSNFKGTEHIDRFEPEEESECEDFNVESSEGDDEDENEDSDTDSSTDDQSNMFALLSQEDC